MLQQTVIIIVTIIFFWFIFTRYINTTNNMKTPSKTPSKTSSKTLDKIRSMLKRIDNIFQEHNITYWIDGGTLLGAVRHQDIIPWDDDGDIVVLHEDKDKLLQLRSKLNNYGLGLGKFWGGYKIFPLDGEKINHENRNWKWSKSCKDIESSETFDYKFPFIDICFIEKGNKDTYTYSSEYVRRVWPNYFYKYGEIFPLKRYLFGKQFFLTGPSNPTPYLKRAYGDNWKTTAYKDYDHKNQIRHPKATFELKN